MFSDFSGLYFPVKGEFSWVEDGATVIDIKKLVILPDEDFTYSSNEPENVIVSIDQENALVKIMPEKMWFGQVPIVIFVTGVAPYTAEKIKEFGRKKILLEEMNFEIFNESFLDTDMFILFRDKVDDLMEEREEFSYDVDIDAELEEDSMNIDVGEDIDIKVEFYPGKMIRKPKISIKIKSALVQGLGLTTAHCDDGIQNYDETGVDCGGASCLSCKKGVGVGLIVLLIFWLGVLLVIYFNIDRLKKFFGMKKKKLKKVKKVKINFLPLFLKLKRRVTDKNVNRLFEKFSDLYRDFFGQLLNIKYEFTYAELKREIKKYKTKKSLEKKLLMLAQVMSDIDYSGYKIKKKEFKKLIGNAIILARTFKPKPEQKIKQKSKKKKIR